jgi:hypothetical protein
LYLLGETDSTAPQGGRSVIGSFDPDQPDDATPEDREGVPLLGYVRAGAEAYYYANNQGPLEWVPRPMESTKDTVAVQIQGDSLGSLFDQWLIYYDDVRAPVTPDLIGRLCVVGLMDDRVVVKKIKRSKTRGLYDLLSNEGKEPIEGVEIIWAARVTNMVPR